MELVWEDQFFVNEFASLEIVSNEWAKQFEPERFSEINPHLFYR